MKDDAVEPGWFAWLQWLLAAIEMKSVVVDHIGDSLSGPLDQRKNRTEADDQQRERDPGNNQPRWRCLLDQPDEQQAP
ncbi:hypothetical protein EI42_02739 [Thermosporothrix hazakensis]|uniref:Uncharacterized protein n=1 Tax=Thermosporothrix hazakensis TaxID=644383 RepID=A0A326U8C8_THEHA|nr:hypothetical protein EI42_02739 [Thermosporothrix hazakensis]